MAKTLSDTKYTKFVDAPCYEWVPVKITGQYSSGGKDEVQATLRPTYDGCRTSCWRWNFAPLHSERPQRWSIGLYS